MGIIHLLLLSTDWSFNLDAVQSFTDSQTSSPVHAGDGLAVFG